LNKTIKTKALISLAIFIIVAVWFAYGLRVALDDLPPKRYTIPFSFENKEYPMRSEHERKIWQAIYDNNLSTLPILLHNRVDYFDQDNEKVNYSKVGLALLQGEIKLPTIQLMYEHGLDLNDLKEVEISWDAQGLLKEHNITVRDVDLVYLPKNVQEKILQQDLDLDYYRYKNIDEYYIVLLAKKLPTDTILPTLQWLLEHTYTPEPTALGYLFSELIERKDITVDAALVKQYVKYGLHFTSSEKDNSVHDDYNSYAALRALFYSGRIDDNTLLLTLKEQDMSINSLDFFGYNLTYQLCSVKDDFIEQHEQGVANLIQGGLILTNRDSLSECSKPRLRLIQKLSNGKAPSRVQTLLSRPEPSLDYKLNRLANNPIFLSYFALAMLVLFTVVAVGVLIMIAKALKKKK